MKDLQKVALEPAMTQQDLEDIDAEINRVTSQINKLVEKRMMQGNPAKDKLGIFRQQVRHYCSYAFSLNDDYPFTPG